MEPDPNISCYIGIPLEIKYSIKVKCNRSKIKELNLQLISIQWHKINKYRKKKNENEIPVNLTKKQIRKKQLLN